VRSSNAEIKKHKHYLSLKDFEPELPETCLFPYQIKNLKEFGRWYEALEKGKILPITNDQRSFLHALKNLTYDLTIPGKHYVDYKKELIKWGDIHIILSKADESELETLSKILKKECLSPLQIVDKLRSKSNTVLGAIDQEIFGAENLLSYRDILDKISRNLKINKEAKSDKELERDITVKVLESTLRKMSPEQKEKFEAELEKIAKEIGIEGYQVGAIFGTLAAAKLSGFGVYMLVTSALSTLSGIIGAVLPFAAYTALTSALSIIIGPVGWIGAGIFALWKLNDRKFKQLIPAVIFIHWLREKYLEN
jgi:uncharacterized protein YaaW (UPF0174 family)